MAPEYGATCGIFPIDGESLNYLRLSGRSEDHIALVEAYAKAQELWRNDTDEFEFSSTLELDMGSVRPSLAGPKRPQDRVLLEGVKRISTTTSARSPPRASRAARLPKRFAGEGGATAIGTEAMQPTPMEAASTCATPGRSRTAPVVIAAITSCTNTSNPAVMLGAGLRGAQRGAQGAKVKPWVKTSLGPGSLVVTDYLKQAGCSRTCRSSTSTSSATVARLASAIPGRCRWRSARPSPDGELVVASVLSGNRNFEGRVHPR
jgi:aconitate hydratase